jgi:hypothetical protein
MKRKSDNRNASSFGALFRAAPAAAVGRTFMIEAPMQYEQAFLDRLTLLFFMAMSS